MNQNHGHCCSKLFPAYLAVLLIAGALSLLQAAPQEGGRRPLPTQRQEIPDDPYMASPRSAHESSPAYHASGSNFFTSQVNVDSNGNNIVGDAANEPSIAVNQNDPNSIVIGWRQFDTVSSNFRQAGYGFTTDGGQNWTFPGVIEPGIFRSDPVLASDSAGAFYYNSLTVTGGNNFHCDVFKSTDGGATWDTGTFAQGGDKQWMAIDKTSGIGKGNIYAFWTQNFSACPPNFFTRSSNNGLSYENCISIPGSPFWGTLDVGPEGDLFVTGVGPSDFLLAKSSNAQDSSQAIVWDYSMSVSLGGDIASFNPNSPNPGGLLGQTWVAVDNSLTATRGNIYLVGSVEPFLSPDPLDVMFTSSNDGGMTWSPPVRINDDPGTAAWQWFGTLSVAPNGRIDVIWLDTRDDPTGGVMSSLYYSFSTDAGVTWTPNLRLSDAFNPRIGWPQQNKMGDYFHMVSLGDEAHLAWANTLNGEQDVYYTRITPLVGVADQPAGNTAPREFSLAQNYPNPFNPTTTISYSLPSAVRVTLRVYDVLGQEVRTLVNELQGAGAHQAEWDGRSNSGNALPSGIYVYRINAGTFTATRQMSLLR